MQLARSALALTTACLLSAASSAPFAQTNSAVDEDLRSEIRELRQKLERLEQKLEQQQTQTPVAAPATPPTAVKSAEPSNAANATEPAAREQAMQNQIDELSQQVKTLGQKQDTAKAPARKASAPTDPYARPGIVLTSPDSDVQVSFRTLLQIDYRDYVQQPPQPPGSPVDTFLVRRARPILEGTAYEKFGFRIMGDWGNTQNPSSGNPQLYDAWIDANLDRQFKIRVGKFKPPIGLERLQSPADLLFVERAFPTDLVPNRDVGVQFSGDVLNRTLNYAVGVFDGAVDNTSVGSGDNNNGKDFDARLFAHPFRNTDLKGLRGLGFGIAYATGNQIGTATSSNLPTYVTPGQQNFFTYNAGAFANGGRVTWAPQLYYSVGPFGVLGEYTTTKQTVTRSTNTQSVYNNAWQIALSWVLTGEDASFAGVIPSHNFNFSSGQWGSFELVGRMSRLTVDSDVFLGSAATRLANPTTQPGKATDYGIGIGWDLNRNIRIMFDYDQTKFQGGAVNGADRPDEKVIITRFQYSL